MKGVSECRDISARMRKRERILDLEKACLSFLTVAVLVVVGVTVVVTILDAAARGLILSAVTIALLVVPVVGAVVVRLVRHDGACLGRLGLCVW